LLVRGGEISDNTLNNTLKINMKTEVYLFAVSLGQNVAEEEIEITFEDNLTPEDVQNRIEEEYKDWLGNTINMEWSKKQKEN
jgi:hypothetical protein